MPTNAEIEKVVLDNWETFKGMRWASPSAAITAYGRDHKKFEADMAEVRLTQGTHGPSWKPSPATENRTRQINVTIQNIRNLIAAGFEPEQIQKMVPDWQDGTGWSIGSIQKIGQGRPGVVGTFISSFGKSI